MAPLSAPTDVPDTADYGVRVAGNSMEPRYTDGQTVWVQYRRTLRSGEIGIFLYDDNAYLKQLIIDDSGVRLHSLNPDYDDVFPYEEGAVPIGRVIGKITKDMIPSAEEQMLFGKARPLFEK